MNTKVYLLLCFHNHQPVGNFDHVIEEAYEKAYLPFLKTLAAYPEVKVTLHYSGYLLHWIERKKDEFITLLAKMIQRGQVELLGGGIYEPVLPLLPERDRVGQIDKMAENLKSLFGGKPRGIWLAERVWEPELAMTLRRAKVEYLPLDDYHFVRGGALRDDLTGYFINEYNGYSVRVFPGLERLRYTIPFREPEETIGLLESLAGRGGKDPCAVFADDGEKLGVWPGTHAHVFEGGWLKSFFEHLIRSREWLKTATLGEYADLTAPRGRVYLPAASYPEMGEWALPPGEAGRFGELLREVRAGKLDNVSGFVQGGYFRNFLGKYEESNQMHKRMLLVSEKVEKARSLATTAEADLMTDSLYRAQNNDSYWHGVFGGLYLPHLRDSTYRNLIRAEKTADRVIRKDKRYWTEVLRGDINRDGDEEVIMKNPKVTLIVHPDDGVSLSELSFPDRGFNTLNVLTRRQEGYHDGIGEGEGEEHTGGEGTSSIHDGIKVKEGVSGRDLVYDRHLLRSFRDEIYDPGSSLEEIRKGLLSPSFETAGLGGFPSCMMSDQKGALKVELSGRDGAFPLDLEKMIFIEGGKEEVRTRVRVINRSESPLSLRYGNAWYVNFLAPRSRERYFVSYPSGLHDVTLGEEGAVGGVNTFGVYDGWQGFTMFFETRRECEVAFSPLWTVSLSESGVEKVYQGSRILFLHDLNIPPGKFEEIDMRVFLENS